MNIKASVNNGFLSLELNGIIERGYTASWVKYHVDSAIENKVTDAVIYINSEGGNVFEAQQIVNELKRLPNVKCTVGALAASAATYIICHFETECYVTSQFMIHKPMSNVFGNEDQIKADMKLLENLTNNYRQIYASKFNKTEEEIDEMWKNDYWFDAKEALSLGIVTSYITDEIWYDEQTVARMVACGCPYKPEIKNPENNKKMNVIAQALGVSEELNEAQIVEKINALKTDSNNWKQKFEALQKSEAENLVGTAVELGLVDATLKDAVVNDLMTDFDQKKQVLAARIDTKKEEISKENNNGVVASVVAAANANQSKGQENETFDYLQKFNPSALAQIRENEPEKYRKLAADYAAGVRHK